VEWLGTVHGLALVGAAIGFVVFWWRTRFWLPRYVHYLAGLALALGLWAVPLVPEDAPINRDEWRALKQAAIILVFPALVYVVFVVYGGQHAAYEARRHNGDGKAGPRR